MPYKDPERQKQYFKEYRENHKEQRSNQKKEHYQLNRKRLLEQKKEYYQDNIEKIARNGKKYRENNKEKIDEYQKEYRQNNKEQIEEKHKGYLKGYRKKRRIKDSNFKILCNLRSRLWDALKRNTKSGSTLKLLGCSINELKIHLENLFQENMTWDNYGLHGWHIDHIKPCASFDFSNEEQQRECFHYTNLQPLWAEDNLRKGINNGS